ncbi:MAG: homogentisate 1,2-dioxygenase [Bacteroidetes bacterium MED-G17]|nr:MAG: homogentisate 1,2-dioxygenase [Bacteroidetes bacterium MED-G17]|tara:strand:+ start:652 stop:1809 length:1158 start_codon:yes stop_codon:yes gene_type:complete
MPFYYTQGKIPNKRHTQFRKSNGKLYAEELVSTEGFSNIYSLLYHCHAPTLVKEVEKAKSVKPNFVLSENLKHRSFTTFSFAPENDYLESRKILFGNKDLYIGSAAPRQSMQDYFYKNADADEVLFIHEGSGKLKTIYGQIPFEYGDYLVIPRGTTYQLDVENENNRIFITESFSPIHPPKRYLNNFGQLLEHAPYCERDIKLPENLKTYDEIGDYKVIIKKSDQYFNYTMASHPFDAIGWDGYVYPFGFSIHNFEPITGRIHLPPPIHQTFEGNNFVICSFVPRLYDYHPQSIPAPYNHSNVDSDEILYYVDGDFMSRKHVEKGMITLHPKGIPHGPHPGTVEKSIGQNETKELAVMIDPFYPLNLTQDALNIEDPDYYKSWIS